MYVERVDVACLPKIADAVEINLDKYLMSDDYWLGGFLEELGFKVERGMLVKDPGLELGGASPADLDPINAEKLHRALELSPELAGNGLFWTIFSHHQSGFIRSRLGLNGSDPKIREKISSNFVFSETMNKRERRTGILPRLWTIADLTCDYKNTPDPYYLTGVALRDLDLTNQILDRTIFMNRSLVQAFLERYDVRQKEGAPMSRPEYRSVFKNLHALSQTIVLESLSKDEFTEEIVKFEGWYYRNRRD